MAQRQWKLCAAAASLVAALLSGCGADDISDDEAPLPKGESLGGLRQQADQALTRYHRAAAAAGPSATVDVSPPPWDASNSPPGISIGAAKGAPDAAHLTVTFIGARSPATESCGADYYGEAVESARAIVVIVIAQRHAANEICTLEGYTRTATMSLARPLGQRAVLEVREGQPVPVDRAPITK
jgi:hypothetical protein